MPHTLRRLTGHFRKRLLQTRWGRLTAATITGLARDDAGDIAAGISYYTFLSVFPLLLGIIGILGYVFPSTAFQQELFDFISKYLPSSLDLLEQNILSIIELRGALGVAGLVGLLWLGSAVFGAIGRAMDRAWGTGRKRPWFIRKVRDISISVLTSILFFSSLGLTALITLLPQVDLPFQTSIPSLTGRLLAFIFVFAAFILLY